MRPSIPSTRPSRAPAKRAPPSPLPPRRTRSDGQDARQHLLLTALALFADKGFAKTSTREIALAAGAH